MFAHKLRCCRVSAVVEYSSFVFTSDETVMRVVARWGTPINEYRAHSTIKPRNFATYHPIKFEFAEFSEFYGTIKGRDWLLCTLLFSKSVRYEFFYSVNSFAFVNVH